MHLRALRVSPNAGAMSQKLLRPRGGAQPEAAAGRPRGAGESHPLRTYRYALTRVAHVLARGENTVMRGAHTRAASRGSSKLAGMFMFALLGSALLAAAAAPSIGERTSELAAAATSLAHPTSTNAQTDIFPSTTFTSGGQTVTVYYACDQETDSTKSTPATLTQMCQPGFNYSITEAAGKTYISPTAVTTPTCPADTPAAVNSDGSLHHCSLDGSTPKESCSSGGGTISYHIVGAGDPTTATLKCTAGKPLDITNVRASGLSQTLGAAINSGATPAQQTDLLNAAGVPAQQQSALLQAYQQEAAAKTQLTAVSAEQSSITSQIQNYANCGDPSCTTQLQQLQNQATNLQQQQQALQTQLAGLNGQEAQLVAGVPPGDAATPAPSGATPTAPSQSATGFGANPTPSTSNSGPGTYDSTLGTYSNDSTYGASGVGAQNDLPIADGNWARAASQNSSSDSSIYDNTYGTSGASSPTADCASNPGLCGGSAALTQSDLPIADGNWARAASQSSSSGTDTSSQQADTSSAPYDQARADAAQTARLNGLASQTLYTQLEANPNPKVQQEATAIVNATKDNTALQASYLNTLATTASEPVPTSADTSSG